MTVYRMGRPDVKANRRTAKRAKPKRQLATKRDRDIAAGLADLYRANKGRQWVFYGDDGTATRAPMDGDFLAALLDEFAKTGTFGIDAARQRKRRDYRIRAHFALLYPAAGNYDNAVTKCAETFKCSESTVRGVVGSKKRENGKPILK